jgi:hypothetical protein
LSLTIIPIPATPKRPNLWGTSNLSEYGKETNNNEREIVIKNIPFINGLSFGLQGVLNWDTSSKIS